MSELLTDNFERRISDLEKRLARLERAAEHPVVLYGGPAKHGMDALWIDNNGQWCNCGRDVCRAPDCPTYKADPLGR